MHQIQDKRHDGLAGEPDDPIGRLLDELGRLLDENRHLRAQLRWMRSSRDHWKEEARIWRWGRTRCRG